MDNIVVEDVVAKKSILSNRRIELSLGLTVNVGNMEFVKIPACGMSADIPDGTDAQQGFLEISDEIMTQICAQHAFAATGQMMQLLKRTLNQVK